MGENKNLFIITTLVMFILFLSWIEIVFSIQNQVFFIIELALLTMFLFAGIGLTKSILNEERWKGLIKFYSLAWINLLIIYFTRFGIKEIILPFLVVGIGYAIAIFKVGDKKIERKEEDPKVEVIDEKPKEKVKKDFSPGKYIASKSGSKYHAPKCDWAKKIKKKNQVWYNSKEEAKEAGKSACKCIE